MMLKLRAMTQMIMLQRIILALIPASYLFSGSFFFLVNRYVFVMTMMTTSMIMMMQWRRQHLW